MIVPTTRLFAAGDILTGAMVNQTVTSLGNFLLGKPVCALYSSVAQTPFVSGTASAITFDTEIVDRDNGHSLSVNTSRYTAATAGYYRVSGSVHFASSVLGSYRLAYIGKNGTAVAGSGSMMRWTAGVVATGALTVTTVPTLVYMNGTTDYVELFGQQDTTAGTSAAAADRASGMTVEWVSL